jgi:hypothetical protein
MSEKLENYLEEISRYLGTGKEKQEILTEIKSHILEKAEQEFGKVSKKTLELVIDTYGKPRQVAEKYMEDDQIIATAFKGHLIRYTAILFAFHFGLILVALIFKTGSMAVLPFFYIPKFDSFQSLFYLPMAFVYDLGLVGIILYFVSQSRKDVKLPWPKLKVNWQKLIESRQAESKIFPFMIMLLGFGGLVWIYLRFGTLFFKTIDFQNPESLLTPDASTWYSLALLAVLGIGIAGYAVKFFATSEWVNLVRSGCQLIILGIVINRPIENPLLEFFYLDLQIITDIIIAVVAIAIAIDFLKSLIILGRKVLIKERHQS